MQDNVRQLCDILLRWCNRWLPIFFGCHCKAERSFYYHGKKFPICARCTGQLVGMVIAIVCYGIIRPYSAMSWIVFLIPLILDGTIQKVTTYESTNLRRLWTGILFGYGLLSLILYSIVVVFRYGYEIGTMLR